MSKHEFLSLCAIIAYHCPKSIFFIAMCDNIKLLFKKYESLLMWTYFLMINMFDHVVDEACFL